jgi:ribose 5-phosphate isomerase B
VAPPGPIPRRYTQVMRIAVASDHAGFDLKAAVARHLAQAGHQVTDFGTDSADVPVDYPSFGLAVGRAVAEGRVERGVCVCGTGIGISMAANKVPGVRAAVVHDVTTASLARRHNDANVICLGGRTLGWAEALDAVDVFFTATFEGGHHQPRLDELAAMDGLRPAVGPGPMVTTAAAPPLERHPRRVGPAQRKAGAEP